MAWIKSHQELAQHPKTLRLARRLKLDRLQAIGLLHCFWYWALTYAQDGDLTSFSAEEIAEGIPWDGDPDALLEALVATGFIDRGDLGVMCIHDWDDYAGRLVDRRKLNAERQRRFRERVREAPEPDATPETMPTADVTSPLRNAPVTRYTPVTSRVSNAPRVEKSREENNTNVSADALVTSASDTAPESSHEHGYPPKKKGEKELDYWLRIVKDAVDAKERLALLVTMAHEKIDVPFESGSYGRIGKLAKQRGAGLLVKDIMGAASQHIDGDPISYLTALCNKAQTKDATARAAPKLRPLGVVPIVRPD